MSIRATCIDFLGGAIIVAPVAITGCEDWPEAEATLNAIESQGYQFTGGLVRELYRRGVGRTLLYAELEQMDRPAGGPLVVRQWMAENCDDTQYLVAAAADIAALQAQGFKIVKKWRQPAGRVFPALQVVMRQVRS